MLSTKNVLISIVFYLKCCFCANILYVEPVPSPSHHIWNKALTFSLAEKGHNVTVITHDVDKGPVPKNYTSIIFEGVYDAIHEHFDYTEFAEESSPLAFVKVLEDWSNFHCTFDLKTKGLEQLMNYPKDYKFDLIIFDATTGQCLYPIIERFNFPPAIAVTAFLLPPYLSFAFGNGLHTSFVPFYAATFTDRMSFRERFYNTIYIYYQIYVWRTRYYRNQEALARKRFGDNIKSMEEYENHFSLLLSNTDPFLDYPQQLPPNIIPVGGLHARPSKNLPQNLEKIVSNAEHGFVIFSLGTNMRSDEIGEERLSVLLETFRKLPQIVIWKYESDNLENIPKNVVIMKWVPVNDLLGHPNVRLFITHGGALSSQEAMYHGVPVVGIPLFADQHVNLKKMTSKNMGLIVDFNKFSMDSFYGAITEVISNPMYSKAVKECSRHYRDQPQTPLERAVFYVERVLRNGGYFPSVASRHMSYYQTENLDILLVLLTAVFIFIYVNCKIMCAIKTCFSNNSKIKTN